MSAFTPLEMLPIEFPLTPVSIGIAVAGAFVSITIVAFVFGAGFVLVKTLYDRLEVAIAGETTAQREARLDEKYREIESFFADNYGKRAVRLAGITREKIADTYSGPGMVNIDDDDVYDYFKRNLAENRAERRRHYSALRNLDREYAPSSGINQFRKAMDHE